MEPVTDKPNASTRIPKLSQKGGWMPTQRSDPDVARKLIGEDINRIVDF
jgi:hypothetical protein